VAEFTVFYSWQSDLPRKLTRDVIHAACASAIERLKVDASLEDAPRLDHDTQEIPGTPEIAGTIFAKIREAGLVIADVSLVGQTTNPNKKPKLLPNPNVLAELGYAAAKVGWDRLILVMNTEHGPPEELPFDLKHRRFPVTFRLGQGSRASLEGVQAKLSEQIEDAIRAALQHEHATVDEIIASLDLHTIQFLKKFGESEAIVTQERKTMGEILGNLYTDAAITKMLDRKVLRCNFHHADQRYVYVWTYIGKRVLHALGVRRTPPQQSPTDLEKFFFSVSTTDVAQAAEAGEAKSPGEPTGQ
jgi:hypothetical protein